MSEMTAPDGFEEYNDDTEAINLQPGDELRGVVLGIEDGESEYGKWYRVEIRAKSPSLGVVTYFAKGEAKTAVANGDVSAADEIWIGVDPEESTYTDPDGEEHTFHEHRFAVATDDQ